MCRRIDDDKGRTHELAQCAVKCMRGILECWLKQADKVEKFKYSQSSKNALHVKFHLVTGDIVTKDEEYEHLQVSRPATKWQFIDLLTWKMHLEVQIVGICELSQILERNLPDVCPELFSMYTVNLVKEFAIAPVIYHFFLWHFWCTL